MKYSELIAKIQERAILNQRYNFNTDFDTINDGLNHFLQVGTLNILSTIVTAGVKLKITHLLQVTETEINGAFAKTDNLKIKF